VSHHLVEVLGFDHRPYRNRAFWTGKFRMDRVDMTRNVLDAWRAASKEEAETKLKDLPWAFRQRLRVIPHPLEPS
jgi:hypothetical protein